MLSPSKKPIFQAIVSELQRMAFAAADPHLDCRDEMQGICDGIDDLVDELFEPEDVPEADDHCTLFPDEEKGGES